ncbi:UNVERIFIED_CONTAM: cpb [Trichonephila clavipes]
MLRNFSASVAGISLKSLILLQDMENKIRNTLNEIYFGKTKDIVNGLRSVQSLTEQRQQADLRNDLAKALQKRQAKGSDI